MTASLDLTGVTRRYEPRAIVDDISLTLRPGEITALLGGSGAGKSTLLRLIAGLEPVDAGIIRLGSEILSEPGRTLAPEKRRIGLIFQDFALFPHLTAARNVGFGLRHLPRDVAAQRIEQWIGMLGLSDRANAYPHELSGGEQQRVAIARTLAPEPAAILMDEPFSGLDPALSGSVRDAALSAVRAANIPALMVTHDPAEALENADSIAILSRGRLLQCGSTEDVYYRPASLAVARALGSINLLTGDAVPELWRKRFGPVICVRPEGIILAPEAEVRVRVNSRRLTGPMVRLGLEGPNFSLQSLVPHEQAPPAGTEIGISLDPSLTFTFASDET